MYCRYYRAVLERKKTWLVVGALRSCEGLAFERTVCKATNQFEFFVTAELENLFLQFMRQFEQAGIVTGLQNLPNRIELSL
ncbi:MAG: hypothetical protein WCE21_04180 [Candidatus Babeliales bacterium]